MLYRRTLRGMPTAFRLREILEARSFSQSELSRVSGVSFTTINAMCANRTKQVSLSTLDKIAAALKIQPGELIERRGGRK